MGRSPEEISEVLSDIMRYSSKSNSKVPQAKLKSAYSSLHRGWFEGGPGVGQIFFWHHWKEIDLGYPGVTVRSRNSRYQGRTSYFTEASKTHNLPRHWQINLMNRSLEWITEELSTESNFPNIWPILSLEGCCLKQYQGGNFRGDPDIHAILPSCFLLYSDHMTLKA